MDLNASNSTSKGRNLGLESKNSSCSDSFLHSIFNLSQATARIEREVLSNQFAWTSNGQCCLKHLRKSLSDKFSKFELLQIQSQSSSDTTPTPPGSPKRASTPLAQTLPIPPSHSSCITFGQIGLHIPPNSPTCIEDSSICGEVFQEDVRAKPVLISISTVNRISSFNSSSIMEQAEDLVEDTRITLESLMRVYTASHLKSSNVGQHEIEMGKIHSTLLKLNVAIEKLVRKFSSQLSQERVNELKAQIPLFEEKFVVYRDSFDSKLTELRKPPSMNNHASQAMRSINSLTLSDSFKVQQCAAIKKVEAKLDAIMEDLVKLSSRASKVDDWSVATDLMVQRAMKENEKLMSEFDKINAVMRDVKELMAEFDLDEVRDGICLQECEIKLIEVSKEVEATIKSVEEQDDVRELYSLDEAKVDKIKLPTFSGDESEDYEKFKSDLLKGFAQNRVTQADKLAKLRECLFGEAKRLVPHSISSSVTEALKVLDQAYGDPIRLFRFRKEHFLKLGKQP